MTWVAFGITGTEIAAAEAAAAIAAEAAAAAAAAETAAATASTVAPIVEAASTVAPVTEGITSVAPVVEGASTVAPVSEGITAVPQAAVPPAPATPLPPAGTDGIMNVANTGANTFQTPIGQSAIFDDAGQFLGYESNQSVLSNTGLTTNPATTTTPVSAPAAPAPAPAAPTSLTGNVTGADLSAAYDMGAPGQYGSTSAADIASGKVLAGPAESSWMSDIGKGFNDALDWMGKNKMQTAMLGYGALAATGAFKPSSSGSSSSPYSGVLTKYNLSPDFQGRQANPEDFQFKRRGYAAGGLMNGAPLERNMAAGGINSIQTQNASYEPQLNQYGEEMASGGIVGYAAGGKAEYDMEKYLKMMENPQVKPAEDPSYVGKVGIYEDLDPDTKYQDALTAAQIRMGKINKRANYEPLDMKRPTPMGKLDMGLPTKKRKSASEEDGMASGGIASLGGYAAGGNPRLLKGPGDGMSDNIPAVIGNKQPARLADGEFVVPADVVSGLGNGSTDAGAKKLHHMMDKVRLDRTGTKKQGKQINPKKYLPKS